MSILRDILRQYWTNLLALAVFACAFARYWQLNAVEPHHHLEPLVLAFVGFCMFAFSETLSEWGDHFDLDRWKWIPTPPWFIRLVGGILLLYFAVALFRS